MIKETEWDERNIWAGDREYWSEVYDTDPFLNVGRAWTKKEFIKCKMGQALAMEKRLAKQDAEEEKLWEDFKTTWLLNNKEEDWDEFEEYIEGVVELFWGDANGATRN